MTVRTRILVGLAIDAVAGDVTGKWGSSGGIAAMPAGVVSVALAPLALDWVTKRKTRPDTRIPPGAPLRK